MSLEDMHQFRERLELNIWCQTDRNRSNKNKMAGTSEDIKNEEERNQMVWAGGETE